MNDSKRIIVLLILSATVSCASGKTEPIEVPPPVPAVLPAEPPPEAKVEALVPAAPAPAGEPAEQVWKVKKGKMAGQPKPLLIGKFKNKKLPGFTSDICYNYKTFSLVETMSTGEMGSAELLIRYDGSKGLCKPEYKGKYANLNIIEGHLAGVAGDYVVIDGDDPSEPLRQFQIFSLETGKEVYKAYHHPDEDIVLTKKGGVTSVTFHAQVKVKCELASDGEACWKKVIEQNGMKKGSPMPDCKTAFEKTKTSLFEMALVTAKAQIANLASPKVEYVGGKSTCVPAPM